MPWSKSSYGGEDGRSRGAAGWEDRSRGEEASWGEGGWEDRSCGEDASWDKGTWENNAEDWKESGGSDRSDSRTRDHNDIRISSSANDAQVDWKNRLGDGRQLRKPASHTRYDAHAQPPRQTAAAAVADAPQQPQQSPLQTAAAASASAPQQPQQSPLQTAAAAVADNAVQPKPSPPVLVSMYSLYTQVGVTHLGSERSTQTPWAKPPPPQQPQSRSATDPPPQRPHTADDVN